MASVAVTATAERRTGPVNRTSAVRHLHRAVSRLITAAPASGSRRPGDGLRVASLRYKPGRGVVVVYRAQPAGDAGAGLITATIAEETWRSPGVLEPLGSFAPGDWTGRWPGIVRAPDFGVRVQAFPADDELPGLAAALDVSHAGRLSKVLEGAVEALHTSARTARWRFEADVVRYRAGSRCVIRYRVSDAGSTTSRTGRPTRAVLFGKLYRKPATACAVHALAADLWRSAGHDGTMYLPRPLAWADDLALVVSEAARADHAQTGVVGRTLLSPAAGSVGVEAASAAAEALAWWHCAQVALPAVTPRFAKSEVERVGRHVEPLGAHLPELAGRIDDIARRLSSALEDAPSGPPRLVHGAFRPNQLVYVGLAAALTDLDDAGPGDPAVDVGSFWAHLRPRRWWHRGDDRLAWYRSARDAFTDRYRQAMGHAGVDDDEVDTTIHTALLFEAASILRMAGHGCRHLSSPRPTEVAAMLDEADACLSAYRAHPRVKRDAR